MIADAKKQAGSAAEKLHLLNFSWLPVLLHKPSVLLHLKSKNWGEMWVRVSKSLA